MSEARQVAGRPRIAVIGGSGALGSGLATQWARAGYPVVIGSRAANKVASEASIYRQGGARKRRTWREAVLMQAVGRLALHSSITSIQTSWGKMAKHRGPGPASARVAMSSLVP